MAKPRTNHEACAYWADGILTREAQPEIEVNSIKVRGDVVYSFGSHFPMGIIVRTPSGRCSRVVLNSDYWPGGGGFANTSGDQWSCRSEARERAERIRVPVVDLPLTSHGNKMIQCPPREDDPEPERYFRTEVPTYFLAWNPGPEPVNDRTNCIAGTEEEYEAFEDDLTLHAPPVENDLRFTVPFTDHDPNEWVYVRKAQIHRTVWGEEEYEWSHYRHPERKPANATYKQCPCCEKFAVIHKRWSLRYHGEPYGRNRGRGFKLYSEMLSRYQTEDGWREARKADWARVRDGRKAWREWYERNFIPVDAITCKRAANGPYVPVCTKEGHATRKDQAAYFAKLRQAEREARRRERRMEEQIRRDRQVERFAARVRKARKPSFESIASQVAGELAAIAEGLTVTVSVNDSREIRPDIEVDLTSDLEVIA